MENYKQDKTGAISQVKINPITYDKKYVQACSKYKDTPLLRLGYLLGSLQDDLENTKLGILEIGYGGGIFLEVLQKAVGSFIEVAGHDITGIKTPEGVSQYDSLEKAMEKEWLCVCLFDVLEHIENPLEFLKSLNTKYVYITVPNVNKSVIDKQGLDFEKWFMEEYWHRKEDEHLWHYDKISLVKMLKKAGYNSLKKIISLEDNTRSRNYESFKDFTNGRNKFMGEFTNTITGIFVKQ